jgi:hypothetical protein
MFLKNKLKKLPITLFQFQDSGVYKTKKEH